MTNWITQDQERSYVDTHEAMYMHAKRLRAQNMYTDKKVNTAFLTRGSDDQTFSSFEAHLVHSDLWALKKALTQECGD